MSKKVISTFFSVAFLLFITAPTILIIVDDTIDVSVIFSISEEEEKGSEKNINIEIFFDSIAFNQNHLFFIITENHLEFFDKKYTNPHLNIISPPPDFTHIIA